MSVSFSKYYVERIMALTSANKECRNTTQTNHLIGHSANQKAFGGTQSVAAITMTPKLDNSPHPACTSFILVASRTTSEIAR